MKNHLYKDLDFNKIRQLIAEGKKLEAVAYCAQTAKMDLASAKFLVENLEEVASGKVEIPQRNHSSNRQRCVITTEDGKTSIFYEDSSTPYSEITPQHPKWEIAKKLLPNKLSVFEEMEKMYPSSNKNTLFIKENSHKNWIFIGILAVLLVFLYFWWK